MKLGNVDFETYFNNYPDKNGYFGASSVTAVWENGAMVVYGGTSDYFVKIKNSRIVKVDIEALINALKKADVDDYFDIFSENYITFVATILECAYLLFQLYIDILPALPKVLFATLG